MQNCVTAVTGRSNNIGKHTTNGKIITLDEYIHRLDVQGALPAVC